MPKNLFEIISGSGLGCQNTSLDKIGSVYSGRALGQAQQHLFVNVATGNLYFQDYLRPFQFLGFQVQLGVVYNSLENFWQPSLGKTLEFNQQTVVVNGEDGSKVNFQFDASTNSYIATGLAKGNQILTWDSLSLQWELRHIESGLIERYDAAGYLQAQIDASQRKLSYKYDGDKLQTVTDDAGRQIKFKWSEESFSISYSDDGVNESLLQSYNIDAQGYLSSSTICLDQDENYTSQFNYDPVTKRLASVTQSDGSSVSVNYSNGKLCDVFDGEARQFHFEYTDKKTRLSSPDSAAQLDIDINSQQDISALTRISGEVLERTAYAYYPEGSLQSVSYPDQSTKEIVYDEKGLVSTITDEIGRVKTFYRDPATSLCFATALGSNIQRFVYNEKRQLIFEINAVGCVTKYEYNDKGNRICARTQFNTAFDLSGLVANQALSLASLTAWWKDPAQQLQYTSRTDYFPNKYGQNSRIRNSAQVDEWGLGQLSEEDALLDITWTAFGGWKQQITQIDANSSFTQVQQQDGLLRVRAAQDSEGNVTQTQYEGLVTKIRFANGLEKTITSDKSNLLIEELDLDLNDPDAQRNKKTERDSLGNPVKITLPNGAVNIQSYDEQKRLILSVDHFGFATRYAYDNRGRLSVETRYALTTRPETSSPDSSIILTSVNDRKNTKLYDPAGQLRYEIDAENYVTAYKYDDLGNRIAVIQHAKPLDAKAALVLAADYSLDGISADPENDREHRYFYNAAKQLIGEQVLCKGDASFALPAIIEHYADGHASPRPLAGEGPGERDLGYVIEYKLDAAGRCLQQIRYSTATAMALTLDAARPVLVPGKDGVTYFVRDNIGRVIGEIHAANKTEFYFTKKSYYGNGKLKSQTRFAKPLTQDQIQAFALPQPGLSYEDQTVSFVYDSHGRILQMDEQPLGRRSSYVYNSAGYCIEKHVSDLQGKDKTRSEYWRYNAYGQVTAHVDVRGAEELDQILATDPTKAEEFWQQHAVISQIDSATGLVLSSSSPLDPSRKTYFYYNQRGQLVLSIDPRGVIEQRFYDAFNQVAKRVYAKMLPADELAKLSGGLLTIDFANYLDQNIRNDKQDAFYLYEFNQRDLLTSSTDPEHYETKITYNAFRQIQTRLQQLSLLKREGFHKARIKEVGGNLVSLRIEPTHFMEAFTYDQRGNQASYAVGGTCSSQISDFSGSLVSVTDASGVSTQIERDALSRQTAATDALGHSTSQSLDAFNRITSKTDAKQQQSTIEYSTAARQTTVTSPEGRKLTTRTSVFDQPLSQVDANQAMSEKRYQSDGKQIADITPEGRENQQRFDLASQLVATVAPNSLETTFDHDLSGDLQAATVLGVVTTSITNDASGQPISTISAQGIETSVKRDRRGYSQQQKINNPDGSSVIISSEFDGKGRKTLEIRGTSKKPSEFVTEFTYDSAGHEHETIVDPEGLALVSSKDYEGDRLIREMTPSVTQYYFYDERGDLQFTVRGDGSVVEFSRDPNHNILSTRAYSFKLDMSAINLQTKAADIASALSGKQEQRDVTVLRRFNKDNQCVFEISARGNVSEYLFDKAGRPAGKRVYANRIDIAKLAATSVEEIRNLLQPDATKDHCRLSILNFDGDECFVIDGCGNVLETRYDINRNKIASISYATPIDVFALIASGDYSALNMSARISEKASAKDRVTQMVYDQRKRPVFSIDPERYVTESVYDNDGNLIESIKYAKPLLELPENLTPETMRAAMASLQDADLDLHTQQLFDGNRNVVMRVSGSLNEITAKTADTEQFSYNSRKQQIQRIDANGGIWNTDHDAAGRLSCEWSANTTVVAVTQQGDSLGTTALHANLYTQYIYAANSNNIAQKITGYRVVGSDVLTPTRTINYSYDSVGRCIAEAELALVDDPSITLTAPGQRSDSLKAVTKQYVYDNNNNKIVEISENGSPLFRCYNSDNELAYTIDARGVVTQFIRDPFSQASMIVQYAHPVADKINLSDYLTSGISAYLVDTILVGTPGQDRCLKQTFDQAGNMLTTEKDRVFTYSVDADRKASFARVTPRSKKIWNAFNELAQTQELAEAGQLDQTAKIYHDRRGNIIAQIEAGNYITLCAYNSDRKKTREIQYKSAITEDQIAAIDALDQISFESIYQICSARADINQDREYVFEYDAKSRMTKQIEKNCFVAVDAKGKPSLQNGVTKDLVTCYEYQDHGRKQIITHPNGATEIVFYDELNRETMRKGRERAVGSPLPQVAVEAAASGSPLPQVAAEAAASSSPLPLVGEGQGERVSLPANYLREVTVTRYDAHNKPALTTRSAQNQDGAIDPKTAVQTKINLFDSRGNLLQKQDGNGANEHVTYTATGKPARQFQWVSGWDPSKSAKSPETIKRLKQTCFTYDAVDNNTQERWRDLMDGNEYQWNKQYNSFGDITDEGSDPQNYSLHRKFDQAGRCWFTNENSGVNTVLLYNTRGQQSAMLRSMTEDLYAVQEDGLESLAQLDFTKIVKTEMLRDIRGNVTTQFQPKFRVQAGPSPLNLVLKVNKDTPSAGKTSLAWQVNLTSEEQPFYVARITLDRGDGVPVTRLLEQTQVGGKYYFSMDISDFVVDSYNYKIDYLRRDPQTKAINYNPEYQTQGSGLVLDTPNLAGSKNIAVQMIDEATVLITGNTKDEKGNDLVGVALYQGDKFIAKVGVTSTPGIPGRYTVDLSDQVSGNYSLKPIYSATALTAPIPLPALNAPAVRDAASGVEMQVVQTDFKISTPDPFASSGNLSWTAVPPGCEQLTSEIESFHNTGAVIKNMWMNVFELNKNYAGMVQDSFSESSKAHNFNLNGNGVIGAKIFVRSESGDLKYLATAKNLASPDWLKTADPAYAYIKTTDLLAFDCVQVYSNGVLLGTREAKPWIDSYVRADLSGFGNLSECSLVLSSFDSSSESAAVDVKIVSDLPSKSIDLKVLAVDSFSLRSDLYFKNGVDYNDLSYLFSRQDYLQKFIWSISYGAAFDGGRPWVASPKGLVPDLIGTSYQNYSQYVSSHESGSFLIDLAGNIGPIDLKAHINGQWIPVIGDRPDSTRVNGYDCSLEYSGRIFYIPNLPENVATLSFEYFDDLGDSRTDDWRAIEGGQKIGDVFVVDIKKLPFGHYRYRMKLFDANNNPLPVPAELLSSTQRVEDGFIYGEIDVKQDPADQVTVTNQEQLKVVSPRMQQEVDRWGNLTRKTNVVDADQPMTDDIATDYTYDKHNQKTSETLPRRDATDEHNQTTSIRQTKKFGYNEMGEAVVDQAHLGGTTTRERNLAGDICRTTLANGVYRDAVCDGFGRRLQLLDPTGKGSTFTWDQCDRMLTEADALGHTQKFSRNERGGLIAQTDGAGATTYFDLDERDRSVRTIQPEGQITTQKYHPRVNELVAKDDGITSDQVPGIGVQRWGRDDFGLMTSHVDMGGAKTEPKYNLMGLEVEMKTTVKGSHGAQHPFGDPNKTRPTPDKDQAKAYDEAGHLILVKDTGNSTTTQYKINPDGRRGGVRFRGPDGLIHQDSRFGFDNCGNIAGVRDLRFEAEYRFDGNGNRRNTRAWYLPYSKDTGAVRARLPIESASAWFTYDAADQMLINNGAFNSATNNVEINPTQGTQLLYDIRGWRSQEQTVKADGSRLIRDINYFDNGLVSTIATNDDSLVSFTYDNAFRRIRYQEEHNLSDDKKYSATQTCSQYNKNGWVKAQWQRAGKMDSSASQISGSRGLMDDARLQSILYLAGSSPVSRADSAFWSDQSIAHYDSFANTGEVLATNTYWPDDRNPYGHDALKTYFAGFDNLFELEDSGTRDVKRGEHQEVAVVKATPDANGGTQSVDGALQGNEGYREFVNDADGRPIYKRTGLGEALFVTGPEGQSMGVLSSIPSDPTSTDIPTGVDINLGYHAVSANWPPVAPSTYQVQDGDTFESIAQSQLGDASRAMDIALLAGCSPDDVLPVGRVLRILQTTQDGNHNFASEYVPINPAAIRGGMYPNIPNPPIKPIHKSFWQELGIFLEVATGVAAGIFAPELAGIWASALGSVLADVAAYTVVMAAANVDEQLIGMATNLQKSFSFKSVLRAGEMGAMEGFTMAELGINPKMTTSPATQGGLGFAKQVALGGLSDMQGQLLLMATHQQQTFNWNELGLATAQGMINYVGAQVGGKLGAGSDNLTNLFGNTIDTFAGNALASACPGVRFDLMDTVVQIAGQTVGQAAGQSLVNRIWPPLPQLPQPADTGTLPKWHASLQFMSWQQQAKDDYDQQQVLLYDASNGQSSRNQTTARLVDQADSASTIAAMQSILSEDVSLVDRFSGGVAANQSLFQSAMSTAVSAAKAELALYRDVNEFGLSAGKAFVSSTADGLLSLFSADTYKQFGLALFDGANALSGAAFGVESSGSLSRNAAREAAAKQYFRQTGTEIRDDFRTGNIADLGAKFGLFASVVNPFGGEEADLGRVAEAAAVVDAGVPSTMRARVLANIAETRTGINATNFSVLTAKMDQIASGYNVDQWGMLSLKKGDFVYGGWPGQSSFYTTNGTLSAYELDKEQLFKALQVPPHPDYGYRSFMRVYEVNADMRVPFGLAGANLKFGFGGGQQIFIQNYESKLTMVQQIELGEKYDYELQANKFNH